MRKGLIRILTLILAAGAALCAAQKAEAGTKETEQSRFEFFLGADLNYRRLFFNERLYDVLLYATPGMKINPGDGWQIALQALLPVVNQYGGAFRSARPGICTVSKEFLAGQSAIKVSGGLFSAGRYGLDARCLIPLNEWFAIEAQAGFTGYHNLAEKWQFSPMDRLTGTAKARFFIKGWNSEFRLSAGRYIYADYGGQIEFYTHFSHTSVGLYAQYGNRSAESAGARVVFLLPGRNGIQAGRHTRFRPASNFRLTYDVNVENYGMKNYMTDPEENEREGSFNRAVWPALN